MIPSRAKNKGTPSAATALGSSSGVGPRLQSKAVELAKLTAIPASFGPAWVAQRRALLTSQPTIALRTAPRSSCSPPRPHRRSPHTLSCSACRVSLSCWSCGAPIQPAALRAFLALRLARSSRRRLSWAGRAAPAWATARPGCHQVLTLSAALKNWTRTRIGLVFVLRGDEGMSPDGARADRIERARVGGKLWLGLRGWVSL